MSAGAGGFTREDDARLDAGEGDVERLGGHRAALSVNAVELGEKDVERLLGAFRRGADIRDALSPVALGGVGLADGVAQAALLPDFGEEPRGHPAGEDGADDAL